ncbi:MAG: hypothetical protein IJ562_11975 [Prevotella sp.]|nr:hypothetical protein [Prevotella sp.]
MKFRRQITSNWDEEQVAILRQHNIKVDVGIDHINIDDLNLYKKLIPLLDKWEADLDFLGSDFTKKERLSADYCIITTWGAYGYPMPDNDFGYLHNTYETKGMCSKCGTGLIQKDDFRVRKVPKHPFWGLEWIYDEFFVRTDLYEKVFKPLGIESRPLRKYKDDSIIDTYVQLVIPVIDEPLDLSTYDFKLCPKCGIIKYDPKTHGYFPLQEHPLPHIYKSKEYFGDGFVAYRRIYVSAYLRDLMIENKMLKLPYFTPCVKSEDLSIKNEGMMEWINAGRKIKKVDLANFFVAIPDDISS